MTPFTFAARIEEVEPGEFLATFADVPEAITSGATYEEALIQAADALAVALEGYLELGRELPAMRAPAAGEVAVPIALPVAVRALLLQAVKAQGLTKVALAERLGRDEKVVRRMLLGKGVSLEQSLAALHVLGLHPALAA